MQKLKNTTFVRLGIIILTFHCGAIVLKFHYIGVSMPQFVYLKHTQVTSRFATH
jgi:hypothetical protein